MKITSKSQIRKGTKFNLLEFNKMFCEKEKKNIKFTNTQNLKTNYFGKNQ